MGKVKRHVCRITILYIKQDSNQRCTNDKCFTLKQYYEIVNEARPLSEFFPTDADFVYRNASNHETKEDSKFQIDPTSNCFTIAFGK